jgi:hypothetical protein
MLKERNEIGFCSFTHTRRVGRPGDGSATIHSTDITSRMQLLSHSLDTVKLSGCFVCLRATFLTCIRRLNVEVSDHAVSYDMSVGLYHVSRSVLMIH